jgi:hypothetical protein
MLPSMVYGLYVQATTLLGGDAVDAHQLGGACACAAPAGQAPDVVACLGLCGGQRDSLRRAGLLAGLEAGGGQQVHVVVCAAGAAGGQR